jgi:hypothetical protein
MKAARGFAGDGKAVSETNTEKTNGPKNEGRHLWRKWQPDVGIPAGENSTIQLSGAAPANQVRC